MSKLIVMHHHPDLDAIGAGWLLVRFREQDFGQAGFAFVPAGQTYKQTIVDLDPNVVHVDTGGGKFDHHDSKRTHLSATLLVYQDLVKHQPRLSEDEALGLLVDFINEIDHFGEYYWPEPLHPRYAFILSNVTTSLHALNRFSNEEVVDLVFTYLDASYQYLKDFVKAKTEISQGQKFESLWGQSLAVKSGADSLMKIAQMMGFNLVVRQDPKTGFTKIKTAPKKELNLQALYDKILQRDKAENWFYHPSGHMLINGSSKNDQVKPTSLSLEEIVQMIKNLNQSGRR